MISGLIIGIIVGTAMASASVFGFVAITLSNLH